MTNTNSMCMCQRMETKQTYSIDPTGHHLQMDIVTILPHASWNDVHNDTSNSRIGLPNLTMTETTNTTNTTMNFSLPNKPLQNQVCTKVLVNSNGSMCSSSSLSIGSFHETNNTKGYTPQPLPQPMSIKYVKWLAHHYDQMRLDVPNSLQLASDQNFVLLQLP